MKQGGSLSRGDLLRSLWPLAGHGKRNGDSQGGSRGTGEVTSTLDRWKRLMDVLDR